MRYQAVLFDVGGPLDDEVAYEQAVDAAIAATVAAHRGTPPTAAALAAASAAAVASHAPNAYQAMLTTLLGDAAAAAWPEVARRLAPRPAFAFRPGLAPLFAWLRGRGLRLGLAANQGTDAVAALDSAGLGGFFQGRSVSTTLGLRKPDPRLFLAVCDQLGAAPTACIMVGDRIDNDIAPARALGMATILFRTGRHTGQQPRSWLEAPDRTVADVSGLRAALSDLVGEGQARHRPVPVRPVEGDQLPDA